MKGNSIFTKWFICSILVVGHLVGLQAQNRLTLEEGKAMALKSNGRAMNSGLELEAARETKKELHSNYFPKVSASAFGMKAIDPILEMGLEGGNLPVYDGNPANLANPGQYAYMPDVNLGLFNQMALGMVSLQQPLYLGGRIKTGNQLAELNVEVKERLRILSENEVLMKTEQEFWQVIVLQEKQKTLESYLSFLDKLHSQVQNAYENGIVIKNDLLKVSIKQQELEVNKIQLENGRKLALMQLCQTIGLEHTPNIVLDGGLEDLTPPERYFVPHGGALEKRAEFQLLEKSVEAAKLQKKIQKANYMPSLGIGLSGYYMDQFENGVGGAFNGLAFASLDIPISDWWGGSHKMNELKLRESMAKNTLEENKGILNLQMEKAWLDLNEAFDQIGLMEQMLEQTMENLRVNQNGYDNGLIQLSDLLEAQALKASTQDKLIEAKNRYRLAITNYLQVVPR